MKAEKTEVDKEISNKKTSLQQAEEAKEFGKAAKLEQQIKELEGQPKNNPTIETNPTFNYTL
jgi:protein-arginine kinase activator protein McsA